MQGSPSQVKLFRDLRRRTQGKRDILSRRGSWVQIPSPAPKIHVPFMEKEKRILWKPDDYDCVGGGGGATGARGTASASIGCFPVEISNMIPAMSAKKKPNDTKTM